MTHDKLFNIVAEAVAKQMDEVEQKDVKMDANLVQDYEADSVDVVAMLLALEGNFKPQLTATNTKVSNVDFHVNLLLHSATCYE